MPASQSTHAAAPSPSTVSYWPAAQKPQVWDPSADWRPAAQSTHSVEPTVDA